MPRHKPSGKKKHLSHALKQAQPVPSWVVARTEGKVRRTPKQRHWRETRSRCRHPRARKRNRRNRRRRKLLPRRRPRRRRKRRNLSKRRTIPFWKNLNKLGRSSLRSKRSRKKSPRRKRKKSRPKKLLKLQQRQRKQKKRSWKSLKRNSMILTFAEYGMLLARSGPPERSGSSESSYLSE